MKRHFEYSQKNTLIYILSNKMSKFDNIVALNRQTIQSGIFLFADVRGGLGLVEE